MTNLPPPPPATPSGPRQEAAGFFGALFDFGFDTFITPRLVKVIYILATVGIGLYLLFLLSVAFQADAVFGVAALVLAPLFAIFLLAMVRMTLEFYLATVRMSEDIHQRLPPA